jgi:hypothetical protein
MFRWIIVILALGQAGKAREFLSHRIAVWRVRHDPEKVQRLHKARSRKAFWDAVALRALVLLVLSVLLVFGVLLLWHELPFWMLLHK